MALNLVRCHIYELGFSRSGDRGSEGTGNVWNNWSCTGAFYLFRSIEAFLQFRKLVSASAFCLSSMLVKILNFKKTREFCHDALSSVGL